MATITGDHVGYPGFQDLVNFSRRRKIFWGAKIRTSFGVEFCPSKQHFIFLFKFFHHFFLNFAVALLIFMPDVSDNTWGIFFVCPPKSICQVQPKYFKDILTDKDFLNKII